MNTENTQNESVPILRIHRKNRYILYTENTQKVKYLSEFETNIGSILGRS
jgi:hypothetical protein